MGAQEPTSAPPDPARPTTNAPRPVAAAPTPSASDGRTRSELVVVHVVVLALAGLALLGGVVGDVIHLLARLSVFLARGAGGPVGHALGLLPLVARHRPR